MAAAAEKNDKQVMDVSKPGKSAPSATSKPIILGHKPMVQDPMVTAETNAEAVLSAPEETQNSVPASPSASKKVISPITEEAAQPEITPEVSEVDTTPPDTESFSSSEESAVVDTIIDQVGDKGSAAGADEEDKKNQQLIDKLTAEKKYVVPIGKVNGKSSNSVLIITLVLFAIFLALIVAIDAELLDPGFDLPFDLIRT